MTDLDISPIGRVHSPLTRRSGAPRQPWETAPNAKLEVFADFVDGLDGLQPGQDLWILTWLHELRRATLKVRPRRSSLMQDPRNPILGVFATRSPDRPNPIGLHRTKLLRVEEGRFLQVLGFEAIDGTPILDIKPVLEEEGRTFEIAQL